MGDRNRIIGYCMLIIAGLLFSIFSISSVEGSLEPLVCCCFPDGGGIISPESECQYEKLYDEIPSDLNCNPLCDSYEPPEETPSMTCNDAAYSVPLSIDARVVRGERAINIEWSSECPAESFTLVRRCLSSKLGSCPQPETLITTSSTSFIDTGAMWDANYTYEITARYQVQTQDSKKTVNTTLGNLECWYKKDNTQFCIQQSTYNIYRPYLTSVAGFPDDGRFSTQVSTYFGQILNKGYYCDASNMRHQVKNCNSAYGSDCAAVAGQGGECSCVVTGGTAQCATAGDCYSENSEPFGLYYERNPEWCVGSPFDRKYCFIDTSSASVDTCYSCKTSMDCIDYKSRDACTSDSCGFSGCSWIDTEPELGIGVCRKDSSPNCLYCDRAGTSLASNQDAHNSLFSICTQERAAALSTLDYMCFFNGVSAGYCQSTICFDNKDKNSCENANPCGFDICRWHPADNACYKDQDRNFGQVPDWMDCYEYAEDKRLDQLGKDEDFRKCESDMFPPEPKLTLSDYFRGIPRLLQISMFDRQTATGSKLQINDYHKNGYRMYICLEEQAGSCQSRGAFRQVNQSSLKIHNLHLIQVSGPGNINLLYNLKNGNNTLHYYAVDKYKNIADISAITFMASENATGPQVAYVEIDAGREIDGMLYTRSKHPVIRVGFLSQPSSVTRHDVYQGQNFLNVPNSYSWLSPGNARFDFGQPFNVDGAFSLVIDAESPNGLKMDAPYYLNFTVDTKPPVIINVTPDRDSVVYSSSQVNLLVRADEKIILMEYHIEDLNISSNFTTSDNITHSISRYSLTDGNKEVRIVAEDYATNRIEDRYSFIMNAIADLDVQIVEPSWGVSSEYIFDIVLSTDNSAQCSYYFNSDNVGTVFDTFYVPFMTTGGTSHILRNFGSISSGDIASYPLHVRCDDGYYPPTYRIFNLSVDTTPPKILEYRAIPEIVVDFDLNTTFRILADDKIVCRYDLSDVGYASMAEGFDEPIKASSFNELKMKQVHIGDPEPAMYSYSIQCMNRAELLSERVRLDIEVDMGSEFRIYTDNMPVASNSTSVELVITTNKKAVCRYGVSREGINKPMDSFSDSVFKTLHIAAATGLSVGYNDMFFQCIDMNGTLSPVARSGILVDTTPPVMLYVNITSHNPTYTNPKVSWPLRSLNARYLAEDNETSLQYSYMLRSVQGDDVLLNWTSYASRDSVSIRALDDGSDLHLTNGSYMLHVRPRNSVGLVGQEMSDSVTIDPTMQNFCENGVLDIGSESDIDCGQSCPQCVDGKKCLENSDCLSLYCDMASSIGGFGVCAPSSCNDGIMNGEETDIDCGGSCGPCEKGSVCEQDSDCFTGNCEFGECRAPTLCYDGKLTIEYGETDIDCGGDRCTVRCSENQSCILDTDCENGLRCHESVCKRCSVLDSNCDGNIDIFDPDLDENNDGIPDWWQYKHWPDFDPTIPILWPGDPGYDPNNLPPWHPNADPDGDGLTNLEEFKYATDPNNPDTDGDGVSDGDEIRYETDPLVPDIDENNDGIPDVWQRKYWPNFDPTVPILWPGEEGYDLDNLPAWHPNADPDGDGLTNLEEFRYGTDPTKSDTDGDGFSDGDEIRKGTDPLDPLDYPKSYAWVYLLIVIIITAILGGGYYAVIQYPEQVDRAKNNVLDFAEKNLGIKVKRSRPRIPGAGSDRQHQSFASRLKSFGVPRIPGIGRGSSYGESAGNNQFSSSPEERRRTEEKALQQQKEAYEIEKKLELKDKIEKSRPEGIKGLGSIISPETKTPTEEWLEIGTQKEKVSSRKTKLFDRLSKVKSGKTEGASNLKDSVNEISGVIPKSTSSAKTGTADSNRGKSARESLEKTAEESEKSSSENLTTKDRRKELFRKLDGFNALKETDSAMESLHKITISKKLTKKNMMTHLESIAKDKNITNADVNRVIDHIAETKKATRSQAVDALKELSDKKKIKKKDVKDILSGIGKK